MIETVEGIYVILSNISKGTDLLHQGVANCSHAIGTGYDESNISVEPG